MGSDKIHVHHVCPKGKIHAAVPGKMVMVGFGLIGQGIALILRHLDIELRNITVDWR